jgi:hypothetical protein
MQGFELRAKIDVDIRSEINERQKHIFFIMGYPYLMSVGCIDPGVV